MEGKAQECDRHGCRESSDKCFLWAVIQRMRLVCQLEGRAKGVCRKGLMGVPRVGVCVSENREV